MNKPFVNSSNEILISQRPHLFSFITLRPERFGAILFNPYLGKDIELNHLEASITNQCTGANTGETIIESIRKRFSLSRNVSKQKYLETLKILRQNHLIRFTDGKSKKYPSQHFSEDSLYFKEDLLFTVPKNVIWDVTYACNLNCPHCLTNSGLLRKDELNTKQALNLIDKLSDLNILSLSLSGGEPFMRSDILTILKHATSSNLRVDIATNGVGISEKIFTGLRSLPIFQIQVSIDGLGYQHDEFRGRKGVFTSSCETIKRLIKEEIAVSVSTTVTKKNFQYLGDIINLALNLGCSGFKAIPFMPVGRGKQTSNQYQLSPKNHLQMCLTLEKFSKQLKGKMNISLKNTFAFLLNPITSDSLLNGPMGCSAGYDTINIGANGTVFPCSFLQDFPLGNVLNNSLKDIWENSRHLKRLRTFQKKEMGEPCSTCDYSPIHCRGGCRAAAYLEYGDLTATDPLCFQSIVHLKEVKNQN